VEVERPRPAPLFSEDAPEQRVSPWRAAGVLAAFTLPLWAAWEPLAWIVAVIGALVVLVLVIGWPTLYAAERIVTPRR
jgi:hypothetical protein